MRYHMLKYLLLFLLPFTMSICHKRTTMLINTEKYRSKTFNYECGEFNMKTRMIRGDFVVDLDFVVEDSTFLYGDSLVTLLNNKPVEHSYSNRIDTLIGKQKRGFFIQVPATFWTINEDTLLINFDGAFFCKNKKITLEEIRIIE